jgi:predicted ArsR family transcriptional regulator
MSSQQIAAALQGQGWRSAQEIADRLNLPTGYVETRLTSLVHAGQAFAQIRVTRTAGAEIVYTDEP